MCSYAAEQEYSIQDTKLAGGSIVFPRFSALSVESKNHKEQNRRIIMIISINFQVVTQ